jgi:hypothetical protein
MPLALEESFYLVKARLTTAKPSLQDVTNLKEFKLEGKILVHQSIYLSIYLYMVLQPFCWTLVALSVS